MTHLGYQVAAQIRRVTAAFEPHDKKKASAEIRLSAQEEEFVIAGLEYANPVLGIVWHWTRKPVAYGALSDPLTPVAALLANYGLLTLEHKIEQKLRADIGEDEEDNLINDLHSIQLTRQRIRPHT